MAVWHESRSWAVAGFFGAMGAAFCSPEVQAFDECGAVVGLPPFHVTCVGVPTSYDTGISYDAGADQFLLTLESSAHVDRLVGPDNVGVTLSGSSSDGLSVVLEAGAQIKAAGHQSDALRVTMSGDGDITIRSAADMWVNRMDPLAPWWEQTSAILGFVSAAGGLGTIDIRQEAGSSFFLAGPLSMNGIYGLHYGLGDIRVSGAGSIYSNEPDLAYGLQGVIDNTFSDGNIFIRQEQSGLVDFTANESAGAFAYNRGTGDVVIEAAGVSNLDGNQNDGIIAWTDNASSSGTVSVAVLDTANIVLQGDFNRGARAVNGGQGETHVTVSGSVRVLGNSAASPGDSAGAALQQRNVLNTSTQSVQVNGNGSIVTDGFRSHGAAADMDNASLVSFGILDRASIVTLGQQSHGINALSKATGAVALDVTANAAVTVFGRESVGARLDAGGQVTVANAGRVTSAGEYGVGVFAQSVTAGAEISIDPNAIVAGGWQSDLTLAPGVLLPSAGVLFNTATNALLFNRGIIGSGADRAIGDLATSTGSVGVTNWGQVTGFVDFHGAGANAFINASGGRFDVRHFADTNGDGVRDTKRVSVSDFGAPTSSFNNAAGATVRLSPVIGEAGVDPAGYYVPTTGIGSRPLEASYYALGRSGVVQGQFTNLGTFSNAGIIDLRGSATGNTLVMTGNAAAGGGAGTGVFISDGGQLLLNSVLNEGVAAGGQTSSFSDVLVVDSTQLGSGATTISIDRREGAGAATPGNGILLVEVRNKAASAPGVFVLNGDIVANGAPALIQGAHSYNLLQNGVAGDIADGNWYLRNLGLSPIVPIYEEYPKVLLPLIDLPTLQQRVGNRHWNEAASPRLPQTVFCKDPSQNYQCVVTDAQASYYLDESGTVVSETNGIWGRIEGEIGRYSPPESTSGARYDTNIWQLQAGLDALLAEGEAGTLIAGLTVNYGSTSADITAPGSAGNITSSGYGLGGTLTWYGANGFYADAQAQLTWLDSHLSSLTAGRSLVDGNKGFGYAFSVEAGQRLALGDHWTLTPQAQLTYSSVSFNSFTDPFGTTVALLQGQSLRGRLGLAAEYQSRWKAEDGSVSRVSTYGIANLEKELLDGTRVSVSGYEVISRDSGLWGGLGLGGSYNWADDKYSIYGEVSTNTALEHFGDSVEFGGTVGLRVKW